MSKVEFKKGLSQNLNKEPIVDGKILFTTDTAEMYLDVENVRKKIFNAISNFDPDSSATNKIFDYIDYEIENNEVIITNCKKDIPEIIGVSTWTGCLMMLRERHSFC